MQKQSLTFLQQFYTQQKGNVSPFLFGLLAGVALFSGGIRAKAELELKRIRAQQEKQAEQTAQSYQRAVEGALLSETSTNFGTLDRDRIEEHLSRSLGGTRSGQDIAIGTITTDGTRNEQRIFIAPTDDDFVRTEINTLESTGDADAAARNTLNNRKDVISIDTSAIRARQVELTMQNLNKEAEIIIGFWGQNGIFPSPAEYTALHNQTNLADFWGNAFTYTRVNDDEMTLSATTPWGQLLFIPINMNN